MPFALGPRAKSAGYRLAAYDSIGSTNAEALLRAREGERSPTWFVTADQTAGRGRRHRSWIAPRGNLACSVLEALDISPAIAATLGFAAGLALETVLLSRRLCPRLEQFDLARNSLYKILEESYNVRIDTCTEDISARLPNAEQRKLLALPRNVAVLVVARKTHTDLGQPVEFTHAAYRGDLYSAVVHSIRKRPIGEV